MKKGKILILVALVLLLTGCILYYKELEKDEEEAYNNKKKEETEAKKEYINNLKRFEYLSSAANYISKVSIEVNAGDIGGLAFLNPNVAYYVPVSDVVAEGCVSLENGGRSPFGNWVTAYVVVTINATGTVYSYYFTALDTANYAVKPIKESSWSRDDIIADSTVDFPTDGDIVTLDGNSYTAEVLTVTNGACTLD